jgi:hypothetical protein
VLRLISVFQSCSSGIENNPTVFYRLMPGSTAQTNKFHTFYLQQRSDNGFTWADIKVNHPLDYETFKEYNLTIRVEVTRLLFMVAHFPLNRRFPSPFPPSCRTTAPSNWRPRPPSTLCSRTSTTRFLSSPSVSRRLSSKASPSALRSLRSTLSTRTARSLTIR